MKTQTIGIFVVRVTGKRKLLGRMVPRIRGVPASDRRRRLETPPPGVIWAGC